MVIRYMELVLASGREEILLPTAQPRVHTHLGPESKKAEEDTTRVPKP